jgi:hypothetical protein
VRAFLTDLVGEERVYQAARAEAARTLRRGLRLGGRPLSRDEVYRGRVG